MDTIKFGGCPFCGSQSCIAGQCQSKAKQEQGEPVAITITGKLGNIYSFTGDYSLKKGDKVYTKPTQRTWVGLEQKDMPDGEDAMFDHPYFTAGMVYADKKLKEKNK